MENVFVNRLLFLQVRSYHFRIAKHQCGQDRVPSSNVSANRRSCSHDTNAF